MNPSIALGIAPQQQQQIKAEALLQTPQEQQHSSRQIQESPPSSTNYMRSFPDSTDIDVQTSQ